MFSVEFSLEEFAARRRGAQARIEEALRPLVRRALDGAENTRGWNELLDEVSAQWRTIYAEERGRGGAGMPRAMRQELGEALKKTNRAESTDATVDRIAVWLSTAVLAHATMTASDDDEEELFVEWVTLEDAAVRTAHAHAQGQVRPIGEKFSVGGHKMPYPGYPGVPIELWINCRCTLRPMLASEFAALTAASVPDDTVCIMAIPAADDPVHDLGDEEKHATLLYFGAISEHEDPERMGNEVRRLLPDVLRIAAREQEPFTAQVTGIEPLGHDDVPAQVWLLDSPELQRLFDEIPEIDSEVGSLYDGAAATRYPDYIPHVTITYGEDQVPAEARDVTEIRFDRIAVWHGSDRYEFPLGQQEDDMSETAPEDEPGTTDTEDVEATSAPPVEDVRVPWHGVLAPEGEKSGDGRGFKEGSLSTRPLPLPLTWQKTSAEGHMQSVVVATIERAEMVDGEMRGSGYYLTTPEADEALGLVAAFGKFGVSVDADDADFDMDDMDEEDPVVWFSRARVCGAAQVPIPAFHQAWLTLGEPPEDFFTGTTMEDPEVDDEALVASGGFWKQFVDVSPGVTEDGPGWLTHPVDTDRLRDYWTHGEGAAKIAWGVPGDFDRCRANLAEHIKPQYLNGYCANRHKDAIGVWPGQEASVATALEDTEMSESISLVAAGGYLSSVPDKAPAAWFTNPNFEPGDGRLVQYKNGTYGCPQTITEDGEVFGHIATFKECHDSYTQAGKCVLAPRSQTDYAHFRLGEVLTDEGPVATGCLTIGGGHAGERLNARQARAHYDDASAAYADVAVGEDEYGIWMHGWVRPGTPTEMIHAARASKPSGDWRKVGGSLELIGAHCVNTAGFRVPRVAASVQQGQMVSLVAAGALPAPEGAMVPEFDPVALALAVVDEIENRRKREVTWEAFAAKVQEFAPDLEQAMAKVAVERQARVDALRAKVAD